MGDQKETDKRPNQKPNDDEDESACDSITKTGLEQSVQIAAYTSKGD